MFLSPCNLPTNLCDPAAGYNSMTPSSGVEMMGEFLKLIELDFDSSISDYKSLMLSATIGCIPCGCSIIPVPQMGKQRLQSPNSS